MTNWIDETNFDKLVEIALKLPDYERKIRLACVAICNLYREVIYPEPECKTFLEAIRKATDENGDFDLLRKEASKKPVMMHAGLFHTVRHKVKTAILEVNSKTLTDARDTFKRGGKSFEEKVVKHQNVWVLKHMFGYDLDNPLPAINKDIPEFKEVVSLAHAVYEGEMSCALSDACEEFLGRYDLADHFREYSNHPAGCFALDLIIRG